MLAKMGWNKGQALGKGEKADSITEPVSDLSGFTHSSSSFFSKLFFVFALIFSNFCLMKGG